MTKPAAFSNSELFRIEKRLYQPLDGHSMGAPMVAAALAVLEEENQRRGLRLSMREVVTLLKDNANRHFLGYDPQRHGRGMLDIAAALRAMQAL
jgi:hypothetical protein